MKYQKSTTSGCKDIGTRKSEFDAKTQFLLKRDIHLGKSCDFDIVAGVGFKISYRCV